MHKRTVLGLLAATSACRGPREPKAGLAGGRCFPTRVVEDCGTSIRPRSFDEGMTTSRLVLVLFAPVRSTGGTGTAGVLGGGVDSPAAGELELEGEESGGWDVWY